MGIGSRIVLRDGQTTKNKAKAAILVLGNLLSWANFTAGERGGCQSGKQPPGSNSAMGTSGGSG